MGVSVVRLANSLILDLYIHIYTFFCFMIFRLEIKFWSGLSLCHEIRHLGPVNYNSLLVQITHTSAKRTSIGRTAQQPLQLELLWNHIVKKKKEKNNLKPSPPTKIRMWVNVPDLLGGNVGTVFISEKNCSPAYFFFLLSKYKHTNSIRYCYQQIIGRH